MHNLARLNEYAEAAYARGHRVFMQRISPGQIGLSIRDACVLLDPREFRALRP